jgi:hypothetical protein
LTKAPLLSWTFPSVSSDVEKAVLTFR